MGVGDLSRFREMDQRSFSLNGEFLVSVEEGAMRRLLQFASGRGREGKKNVDALGPSP